MASNTPAKLFRTATGVHSLSAVFEDYVQKGAARGRDGLAPTALENDIEDLCRRISANLRRGEYRFTQYRELLRLKGAGKAPRVISIPTARDRITLRALADFLGNVYPDARGVIPQKRVAEVHEILAQGRFDSYVRLDVQDFYPSIDHTLVLTALRRRIRKSQILDVVMDAIRTPTVPDGGKKRPPQTRGVPQGLAISNLVAELVALPIDTIMTQDERCQYVRFVDDVLILCNKSDISPLARKVIALFEKRGLTVHKLSEKEGKSTSGQISNGFDYLGYVFRGDLTTVRKSSIYKVESSLARAFTRYKKSVASGADASVALAQCKWRVDLTITGCIYKGAACGWLHYFRQMNDRVLLKRLDATVRRFERRFEMPQRFTSKRFMRAFWSIHHPGGGHAGYIPNYDSMSIDQMRSLMADIVGPENVLSLNDDALERLFHKIVGKAVSDLEQDVASLY